MGLTRSRRLLAAWLALLALALNAAWPLVAKASAGTPHGLSDICSVAGTQQSTDGTDHSRPPDLAASHCSFCSSASDKAIFIPQPGLPVFSSVPRSTPAGVEIFIPRRSARTLCAAPRAPPSYS